MSLDQFFGYWLFAFFAAYCLLVILRGIRAVFPREQEKIRVDFKSYDD